MSASILLSIPLIIMLLLAFFYFIVCSFAFFIIVTVVLKVENLLDFANSKNEQRLGMSNM